MNNKKLNLNQIFEQSNYQASNSISNSKSIANLVETLRESSISNFNHTPWRIAEKNPPMRIRDKAKVAKS